MKKTLLVLSLIVCLLFCLASCTDPKADPSVTTAQTTDNGTPVTDEKGFEITEGGIQNGGANTEGGWGPIIR